MAWQGAELLCQATRCGIALRPPNSQRKFQRAESNRAVPWIDHARLLIGVETVRLQAHSEMPGDPRSLGGVAITAIVTLMI